MDEECRERSNALSARITALEKLIDERWSRAEDRFVSIDRVQTISTEAAKEAVAKLEAVYLAQHKTVLDRIDVNTNRLTVIEQRQAALQSVKKESLGTGFQISAIAGVAFSVVISLVTVVFNILTYNKHP